MGLDESLPPRKIQVIQPFVEKAVSDLFIIALSYEGPLDGYIILMDSDCNILDKREVGYIKSISLRSSETDSDDSLIIDAIARTGTGTRTDFFYIFSMNNKLEELWRSVSYEKSIHPELIKEDNYEIFGNFHWESADSDENEEIIYTSKRIKYSFDETSQKLNCVKTEKETKVFKLINGKYVFFKKVFD